MAAAVIVGAKHQLLEEEQTDDNENPDASHKPKKQDSLPEYLQSAEYATLPAVQHLDHGQFELIAIGHVEKLFDVLGKEQGGRVCATKVQELLQMVVFPPFSDAEIGTLFADTLAASSVTAFKDCFIFAQDFYEIFHSKKPEIVEVMTARREQDQQVDREYFRENIARIVDRDDAFMTLPITLMYMLIYIYLVQGHLRIYDRRLMENALEEFVNGRDPRETADENIDDIDSLWEWVTDAGLRGPFGNVKNSTDNRFKQCILASRNVLVGDVKLTKVSSSGAEDSVWLLNSVQGKESLKSYPHEYQKAAIAAASHLKANLSWDSTDIEAMTMSFSSYNDLTRMFAITKVYVPLPKLGNVNSKIDSSAVSIEPYPTVDLYIADSLFMCLALWIGYNEAKDAFQALRLGCDEFRDYLAFWNIVDWINIVLCAIAACAWVTTINYMIDDSFNSLLDKDFKINQDVMLLSAATMDTITTRLSSLRVRYWAVQITMALNTVSIVMKFFKSFESNARLRVVSTTFKAAFIDLVHFFIMFSTIFLPFVIIGHILFGSDIQAFASVTSSINTGMTCLMGDFTWYVEDYPTYFTAMLPSGMPKIVLMVWYVSFMFLVFLVLLNMLLAVILEHYTAVSTDVQFEVDAPAIWNQAIRYWRYRKETKGFIPLENLRGDLENDDSPGHPETSVTVTSLLKAWPNMTEDQAAWLMAMLDHFSAKGQEQVEAKFKAKHVKHLAEVNKEKLVELSGGILDNKRRLDDLEGVQGGVTDISAGLEKLANIVTDLNVSVAKVRKEHDRLSGRVDDMVRAIPEGHRLEVVDGAPRENTSNSSSTKAREWKKAGGAVKSGSSSSTKEGTQSSRSNGATRSERPKRDERTEPRQTERAVSSDKSASRPRRDPGDRDRTKTGPVTEL